MGFSRQEYWSGLPCPPPGDLPHPGTEPAYLLHLLHCKHILLLLSQGGSPIYVCVYIYTYIHTHICLSALIKSTEKLYSNYKYKGINFKPHNLKMIDNALNFFPLLLYVIQPVHPKGHQSWIFIGRTDVEAETPILCPPDAKSWLIWKGPDARKDWRWEEKGMIEDEMVGWHHWLNGHEFE